MAYDGTVLRQLLQCVPRLEFERLATKVDGPRRSDALSRWSQFLALVVGHVGQRHSLHDIEFALMSEPSLRYHLNTRSVSGAVDRTMVHEGVKTLPTPEDGPVLRDQIIRLSSRKAWQAELPEIRRA